MKISKIALAASLTVMILAQSSLTGKLASISADEQGSKRTSMRDKYAAVVTSLSDKGYSFIHNDHQHFVEDLPENNSKFLENLVVEKGAAWEPEDVIMVRKNFFVIQGKDSYKIAARKGVDREKLLVKQENLTEEQTKALSSMNVTFEDGYVFDPKDIVDETDAGYIVRHGDHFHFVPKQGKESKLFNKGDNNEKKHSRVENSNKDSEGKKDENKGLELTEEDLKKAVYTTDDGYVFDPKDIVMEDKNGYVVRHGDHFHYIYKKDLLNGGKGKVDSDNGGKTDSKDDGKTGDSSEYDDFGKIIPGKDVEPNESGETNEQGLKKDSEILSEVDLAKVKYFAEKHGIALKDLTVSNGLLIWPHSDHFHADPVSTLPEPPKVDNSEHTAQGLKGGSDTLSDNDLKKVDMLLESIGLSRADTFVKDGKVTIQDPKRDRKWEYKLDEVLLNEDFPNTSEVNEQGLKLGSDKVTEKELEALKKYANSWGLDLSDLYVKNGVVSREKFDSIVSVPISEIMGEDSTEESKDDKNEGDSNTPSDKTTAQGLKEGSDTLSDDNLKKVKYFAEVHHLNLKDILVTGDMIIWPHLDHHHADSLKAVQVPEDWKETSEEDNSKKTDAELEAEFIKELERAASAHGVKPDDITLTDDGQMIVPHGDHTHTYPIRNKKGYEIYKNNQIEPVKNINVEGSSGLNRQKVREEIEKAKDDARYYFADNINKYKKVINRLNQFEELLEWGTNSTEGYLASLKDFRDTYFVGDVDKEKVTPINPDDLRDKDEELKEEISQILVDMQDAFDELDDIEILTKTREIREKMLAAKSTEELETVKSDAEKSLAELKERIKEKKDAEASESGDNSEFENKFKALSDKVSSMDRENFTVKYVYFSNQLDDISRSKNLDELNRVEKEFEDFIKENPTAIKQGEESKPKEASFEDRLASLNEQVMKMDREKYTLKYIYFSNKTDDLSRSKDEEALTALENEFKSFLAEHSDALKSE